MISRRDILANAGALAALAISGSRAALAQSSLEQRAIPKTGERLPVIGLGTYRTFNVGDAAAEREPLQRVTELFFAQGGTVVDSSPRYGPSEAVFGDVLAQIDAPEALFAATKVDADGREAGIRQMSVSPETMGVERIDLMQVHNLRDWRTHLPTLKEWKARGEFRYIGISASREDLYEEYEHIMRSEPLDVVQINYSLGEQRSAERILPLAADLGMGVFINRPFVAGELFARFGSQTLPDWAAEIDCDSWAQVFLKFVLSHPAVTVVLQATADPAHLLDNLEAARGRLPDSELLKRITGLL
jgi:aryl-alcohol dehydrogenase-like predicted oxidoreductase